MALISRSWLAFTSYFAFSFFHELGEKGFVLKSCQIFAQHSANFEIPVCLFFLQASVSEVEDLLIEIVDEEDGFDGWARGRC